MSWNGQVQPGLTARPTFFREQRLEKQAGHQTRRSEKENRNSPHPTKPSPPWIIPGGKEKGEPKPGHGRTTHPPTPTAAEQTKQTAGPKPRKGGHSTKQKTRQKRKEEMREEQQKRTPPEQQQQHQEEPTCSIDGVHSHSHPGGMEPTNPSANQAPTIGEPAVQS